MFMFGPVFTGVAGFRWRGVPDGFKTALSLLEDNDGWGGGATGFDSDRLFVSGSTWGVEAEVARAELRPDTADPDRRRAECKEPARNGGAPERDFALSPRLPVGGRRLADRRPLGLPGKCVVSIVKTTPYHVRSLKTVRWAISQTCVRF